tara:strand:+ start:1010 stop:1312 length:303 start_codon:yes stop_codon:yes gene_type:complete
MQVARNSLILLSLPLWLLFAWMAKPLVTGVEGLTSWTETIISSKNALFFFNIIAVAMMGGYLASRYRDRKTIYITIQVGTLIAVLIVGYVTSQINTIWLT